VGSGFSDCAPTIILPTPTRSVTVRDTAAPWIAIPQRGRIRTSEDLKMEPLRNSVVAYENARIAVLVGVLRNNGACATNLSVRLRYTDKNWQPIGEPVENDALVSQVDSDGLLPFRFPLRRKDEFGVGIPL
jgi:hypothetical protein